MQRVIIGLARIMFLMAPAVSFAFAQRAPLPRKRTPTPTTAEISVADVMTRTYIIADDSMEGRNTGRRGGLKAANYIASELKRLGVEPAGNNGTYFQAIPWVVQSPDPANTLRAGTAALTHGTDYILLPRVGLAVQIGGQPFGAPFRGDNVPVVFGGRLGDSASMVPPASVRGKAVVFAPPAAGGGGRGAFQFWGRDNLRRYRGAAAIIVATLDAAAPQQVQQFTSPRETFDDSTLTGDAAPLPVLSVTTAAGEKILGKPLTSAAAGDAGLPLSGSVRFADNPTEAPSYNVVGILRGRDAKLRNTYVAVGSHHDHVGIGRALDHDSIRAFNLTVRKRGGDDPQPRAESITAEQWARIRALMDSLHTAHGGRRPDSISNGADDDGSGTVLALELAEAFAPAPNRPARSILFVFHTAEEKGLYGAQYYSDHPTVPRDSIIANVNLDQMGRGDVEDEPPGGPNALVIIGNRRQSAEMGDLIERINARHNFTLDYQFDAPGHPSNGWCRSDHYMYARYGIPSEFFVAGVWYPDLHMVTDEPQYIAYERMTKIGRYVKDYVSALATLDHRPVADKPKMDVNARCVQ
jgi:hypothetical protein